MDDEEVSKLRHELARMKKSFKKLQVSNLDQKDEIRALKTQARSYEEEITTLHQNVQMLEEVVKNKARSYEDAITTVNQKAQTLEEANNKARSYEEEITTLNQKVQMLEEVAAQGTPARNIGREVRLRYLEKYRQRIGRSIGPVGYARIKTGDRAAHRGRSVVDALLCLTGEIEDRKVYPELYGVSPETMKKWKDVPEMVEVTNFRASLQAEGRLTAEFRVPFERLIELAMEFQSSPELIDAFAERQVLQQLHLKLQNCYDKIVAAHPYINSPASQCSFGRLVL